MILAGTRAAIIPFVAWTFAALCLGVASPSSAADSSRVVPSAPARVLFAIGNNLGGPDDEPLAYAELDAMRISKLFTELGDVQSDRTYVLTGQRAADVRRRMAEVSGRVAELRANGRDVLLIVYVSSHAKAGILHLRGTELPIRELRELATQTKARLQLVIVDACSSGSSRQKGGQRGKTYDLAVDRLPLLGQVMLSSSGPAEPSQEWDALRGSLFTHHFIAALRGDADVEPDGRVTLSEAYAYAFRRTVLDSVHTAQHPSFDFDVTGTGELVLTQPSQAGSALRFEAALEGRYIIASQPRPNVLIEILKQQGKPLRLAVPPGRYLVRKRMGASLGLLEVELPYGGERIVDERQMTRHGFTDVAMKGSNVIIHPSSLLLTGNIETAPLAGSGVRIRPGIAYRRVWSDWYAQAGLSLGVHGFRGQQLDVNELSTAVSAAVGHRLPWEPFNVSFLSTHVGLVGELVYFRQSFDRDLESHLQAVYGVSRLAPRASIGGALGAQLGVELPLWPRTFILGDLEPLLRHLPAQDDSPWSFGLRGRLSMGVTL